MPIYAYKCGSCGHARDVLQKISDTPLSECPACGASSFSKQVTAAGFQLKGSGWYATDFKNGSKGAAAPAADAGATAEPAKKAEDAKPAEQGAKPAEGGPAAARSDSPAAAQGRGRPSA
jgi:putative FmdB family regulatory protein